ncbi:MULTISPECIES: hypothetical protein [unclassified Pseudofrankia]|uniref:hypothetical protein n=1 Tax=unclassified Pseudofrankia TaxID=2994372 RepID=UPI0008D97A68|nr:MULTISPECIES: hypothetical protein [unclassified Pseudofrankia]MDT3438883.1 hypothetical protein [Pseudofrankia sp. BMG5.37]OHV74815.1 hypothetical protein BCD48_00505 [Pseudofrankia sp. BMG5.36]
MPTESSSLANPPARGEASPAGVSTAVDAADTARLFAQPTTRPGQGPRRRSRAVAAVAAAAALAVGSLTACGHKHPPKPANFSCSASNKAEWSDKEKRWVCVPKSSGSSSDGSSSGKKKKK